MSRTLNEIVTEALYKWVEVAGIDLSVLDPNWAGTLKDWHHQRELEMLQQSWDLDPTGLTTLMLIRGSFEDFLHDTKFSAMDLVLGSPEVQKTITTLMEMRRFIEAPEVVTLFDDFKGLLLGAAQHYGAAPEPLQPWLDSKLGLAELRRDALAGVEKLECHQFTQGNGSPKPMGFNPKVYEFWNVNSLLAAMRGQMAPGITLCLIRDPAHPLESFFVFAIKNGDNILFLTDRAKVPHPAAQEMQRDRKCYTRSFMERASRFWLPYDLLNLRATLKGDDEVTPVDMDRSDLWTHIRAVDNLYAEARTSLVPYNRNGVPLKDIRNLEAPQILWLIMMFDLINDKFWREGQVAPQLSYTGEMVVNPTALVGETAALVREGLYKPLDLPTLDHASMEDIHTSDQWCRRPTDFNLWMVQRYEGQVPQEALNVTGYQAVPALVDNLRQTEMLPPDTRKEWDLRSKKDPHGIRYLEPTTFGTREDLDKDRKWVARVNQVKVIQHLADQECDREIQAVWDWYSSRVRGLRETLLDAGATGSLMLPSWRGETYEDGFKVRHETEHRGMIHPVNVLSRGNMENPFYGKGFRDPWGRGVVLGTWSTVKGDYLCCERDTLASVCTHININCPEAVAALLGMKVEDLPWALQHFYDGEPPYSGNAILDRLDPQEWMLKNPWVARMTLHIRIYQSKSAINARTKKLGLPRVNWADVLKSKG